MQSTSDTSARLKYLEQNALSARKSFFMTTEKFSNDLLDSSKRAVTHVEDQFSFSKQFEKRPWLWMLGGICTGFLLGTSTPAPASSVELRTKQSLLSHPMVGGMATFLLEAAVKEAGAVARHYLTRNVELQSNHSRDEERTRQER